MKISQASRMIASATAPAAAVYTAFMPSITRAADCPNIDQSTAGNLSITQGADCAKGKSNADSIFGANGVFHTISNILIFLIGAVAVIMLIVGGFRYVVSGGNDKAVASAKNTILYAVIGIVVAILAYAIVGFVTGSLAPNSNS